MSNFDNTHSVISPVCHKWNTEWPKPIQCAALQRFTAFQMDTELFDWNMLITEPAIHLNSVVMWNALLLKCVTPESMESIAALSLLIHQFLPEILYDFQHYHFAPTGVRDVMMVGHWNVGRPYTFLTFSDSACCHRALLSSTTSSWAYFIAWLSYIPNIMFLKLKFEFV